MCIACEQDALWFAFLRCRGLILPDARLVEQPPFLAGAIEPAPSKKNNAKQSRAQEAEIKEGARESAGQKIAGDDSTAR